MIGENIKLLVLILLLKLSTDIYCNGQLIGWELEYNLAKFGNINFNIIHLSK